MPAFITAGASLLGGYLSGKSAEKAARTQADAQMKAAQLAAEEARFRPVGITTRFGQSQFQTGPEGRVLLHLRPYPSCLSRQVHGFGWWRSVPS